MNALRDFAIDVLLVSVVAVVAVAAPLVFFLLMAMTVGWL